VARQVAAIIVSLLLLVGGGLLVMSVNFVRESARRIQCGNNLHALGQGLIQYRDTQGHFPPGTVGNTNLPPDKRLSWHIETWGFMIGGEKLLIDKALAWDADVNREPKFSVPKDQGQIIPIGNVAWLTCPANPNRANPGRPGFTHYVGVAGIGEDSAMLAPDDPRAGVFGYERKLREADIKDGISTTLMVIETATANGPWTAGGRPTVRGLEANGVPYLGRHGQFSSFHAGGITNAVFADGSVRSFLPGVAPQVFDALATIAGGEQVCDNDY
jgi:prepilin-type processing-associated H-X9-DG protein